MVGSQTTNIERGFSSSTIEEASSVLNFQDKNIQALFGQAKEEALLIVKFIFQDSKRLDAVLNDISIIGEIGKYFEKELESGVNERLDQLYEESFSLEPGEESFFSTEEEGQGTTTQIPFSNQPDGKSFYDDGEKPINNSQFRPVLNEEFIKKFLNTKYSKLSKMDHLRKFFIKVGVASGIIGVSSASLAAGTAVAVVGATATLAATAGTALAVAVPILLATELFLVAIFAIVQLINFVTKDNVKNYGKELSKEIDVQSKEVKKLKTTLKKEESNLAETEKEIRKLKGEGKYIEEALELRKEINDIKKKLKDNGTNIEKSVKVRNQLNRKLKDLKKVDRQITGVYKDIKKLHDTLDSEISSLKIIEAELKGSLKGFKNELQGLEVSKKLLKAEQKKANCNEKIKNTKDALNKAEGELLECRVKETLYYALCGRNKELFENFSEVLTHELPELKSLKNNYKKGNEKCSPDEFKKKLDSAVKKVCYGDLTHDNQLATALKSLPGNSQKSVNSSSGYSESLSSHESRNTVRRHFVNPSSLSNPLQLITNPTEAGLSSNSKREQSLQYSPTLLSNPLQRSSINTEVKELLSDNQERLSISSRSEHSFRAEPEQPSRSRRLGSASSSHSSSRAELKPSSRFESISSLEEVTKSREQEQGGMSR